MNKLACQIVFALVNFIGATAQLLTLGFWMPGWVIDFARWHARRIIKRRIVK